MAFLPRLRLDQVPLDQRLFEQFLVEGNYAQHFDRLRDEGFNDNVQYRGYEHSLFVRSVIEHCVVIYYATIYYSHLLRMFMTLQPPIFSILRGDPDTDTIFRLHYIEERFTINKWVEHDRVDLFDLLFDSYPQERYSTLFTMGLEIAVGSSGYIDIYDKLLEVGFVPSFVMLIHATITDNLDLLIRLLNYGVPVNRPVVGFYGPEPRLPPPMLICIKNGKLRLIDYLVAYGADINLPFDDGMTPLIAAIDSVLLHRTIGNQRREEIIDKLLDCGADPNSTFLQDRYSLIDGIKKNLSLPVLEKMIVRGANVNHQNSNGETPLSVCINNQQRNLLIRYGAI